MTMMRFRVMNMMRCRAGVQSADPDEVMTETCLNTEYLSLLHGIRQAHMICACGNMGRNNHWQCVRHAHVHVQCVAYNAAVQR